MLGRALAVVPLTALTVTGTTGLAGSAAAATTPQSRELRIHPASSIDVRLAQVFAEPPEARGATGVIPTRRPIGIVMSHSTAGGPWVTQTFANNLSWTVIPLPAQSDRSVGRITRL